MVTEIADNVPESVREQAAEAERGIEALRSGVLPEGAPPVTQEAAQAATPAPAAAPVQTTVTDSPLEAAPPAEQPVPPRATEATAAPAVHPPSTPASPVAPDGQALQSENAKLRHQLSSFHGKYGNTVAQLRRQVADLETRLTAAPTIQPTPQSTVEPQPAQAVPAADMPAALKYVNEDDRAKYGDDFYELVANVARGIVEAAPGRTSDTTDVTAAVQRVEDLGTRMESDRFWAETERYAPGARSVNGDEALGLPCATGWGTFLDTPVRPGSMITLRDEAGHAMSEMNAPAFAALVNEFYALSHAQPGAIETPSRPSVESQTVPKSVAGDPPPAVDKSKRIIPHSEIVKWQEKCAKAAPGSISIEAVEAKTKEYDLAFRQDRVDITA